MISTEQHKINTAYNRFILDLIVWKYLYNKVKSDTDQGYNVVKNKNKLDKQTDIVSAYLDSLDLVTKNNATCHFINIDDDELIKYYKDNVSN